MSDFFGFGGYQRPIEGYLSWQHLTFVSVLTAIMIGLAVFLGRNNRNRSEREKNRVLIAAALLMDAVEIFKIVVISIRDQDPMHWLNELPLFLCSIQLITLPIAAFSKGKLRVAALDFICIFGLLGAILGNYLAGNIYAYYPVISVDTVASGITHSISGFAALYIFISGMASMEKKNMVNTFLILGCFGIAAYIADITLDCNYMFLMQGDGTPYDILYNLVGGNPVLYPIGVMVLFAIYITGFYGIYQLIQNKRKTA